MTRKVMKPKQIDPHAVANKLLVTWMDLFRVHKAREVTVIKGRWRVVRADFRWRRVRNVYWMVVDSENQKIRYPAFSKLRNAIEFIERGKCS